MSAVDRYLSELHFHDEQAKARALTYDTDPDRFRREQLTYLEHESWIAPAFEQMKDVHGLCVLDLGCGNGMAAVELTRRGARVVAFDLSLGYVREAHRRAEYLGARAAFLQADGHRLPFATGVFDRIWGSAILHHLDLTQIAAELQRVLKPGGRAVFCEPWGENPLLNLARRYLPYPHKERTPDEEPLTRRRIRVLRKHFSRIEVRGYQLLSMIRRWTSSHRNATLESCDSALFRLCPMLQRFARYAVLTLDV